MASKIVIYAAEKTPVYLPLYVAEVMARHISSLDISIQFSQDDKSRTALNSDGDLWAIEKLTDQTKKLHAGDKTVYLAACDPLKILGKGVYESLGICCSLVSKAAFWSVEIGANNPSIVYTYPQGMSAYNIAERYYKNSCKNGMPTITPVIVDHELCHLVTKYDDTGTEKNAGAFTANYLLVLQFERVTKAMDGYKRKPLAKKADYGLHFLTGLICIRSQVENRDLWGFYGLLEDSIKVIKDDPGYVADVLAEKFAVTRTIARQVVEEFNDIGLFDSVGLNKFAWSAACNATFNGNMPPGFDDVDDAYQKCAISPTPELRIRNRWKKPLAKWESKLKWEKRFERFEEYSERNATARFLKELLWTRLFWEIIVVGIFAGVISFGIERICTIYWPERNKLTKCSYVPNTTTPNSGANAGKE